MDKNSTEEHQRIFGRDEVAAYPHQIITEEHQIPEHKAKSQRHFKLKVVHPKSQAVTGTTLHICKTIDAQIL
jgi:hypothetical protein